MEILENTRPTRSLVAACNLLHKKGYKFALDDFVFDTQYEPFIEFADIVKVDFLLTASFEERRRMRSLIPAHVRLLAEKLRRRKITGRHCRWDMSCFRDIFSALLRQREKMKMWKKHGISGGNAVPV